MPSRPSEKTIARFSEGQRQIAKHMYLEGTPISRMGKAINAAPTTVTYLLKSMGVQMRKRGEATGVPLVAEEVTQPRAITAAQTYDERLAKFGKLIRLEPYRNTDFPILHRCLEHGVRAKVSPSNALQGKGMLCCKKAAQKACAQRRSMEAASRYDGILSEHGKLKRLEPYKGNKTPILHLCLIHNEQHKTTPTRAITGGGLLCCQKAGRAAAMESIRQEAARTYDSKIAKFGRVIRLEPYDRSDTPILTQSLVLSAQEP